MWKQLKKLINLKKQNLGLHHFKAFILDEQEVWSYTLIFSLRIWHDLAGWLGIRGVYVKSPIVYEGAPTK